PHGPPDSLRRRSANFQSMSLSKSGHWRSKANRELVCATRTPDKKPESSVVQNGGITFPYSTRLLHAAREPANTIVRVRAKWGDAGMTRWEANPVSWREQRLFSSALCSEDSSRRGKQSSTSRLSIMALAPRSHRFDGARIDTKDSEPARIAFFHDTRSG